MTWILVMLMTYVINPATPEARLALENTSPNLLCQGIGGTCKTHTGAEKAIYMGSKYPRNRVLLMRKKRTDLRTTLWTKFKELLPGEFIARKGGHPQISDTMMSATLRNGSEILGLGMDSEEDVNKLASMEAGFIVVEEATEIPEHYYDEKIRRACRLPRVPFHQVVSLCNPGPPTHWIKKRWIDQTREGYFQIPFRTISPYLAEDWLKWFHSLTGIFRARYHDGKWVGAEGLVYPFDPNKHSIESFDIPDDWQRVVALDFGFSLMHAFCVHWWAISPKTFLIYPAGSWFCYRQIYTTGKTVSDLAPQIKKFMQRDELLHQAIICDHDADGRAELNKHGIKTRPAIKKRIAGQQRVHDLIANDKMYYFKNSLVEEDIELKMHKLPIRTEDEYGFYTWANKDKEDMITKYDHGQDTSRYAVLATLGGIEPPEESGNYAPNVLRRA